MTRGSSPKELSSDSARFKTPMIMSTDLMALSPLGDEKGKDRV